jgi:hypothetical protein
MWDYLAAALTIVLAGMGIIPTLSAFNGRKKSIWISGIIAVVVLDLLGSFLAVQSMHAAQEENLGGDNFLTIIPVLTDPKDTKASFPLFISNEQRLPVYDVSLQIVNHESVASNVQMLMSGHRSMTEIFNTMAPKPITVGTVAASSLTRIDDTVLPVGTYQIQIQTRRGLFSEQLTLRVENGEVSESFYITKAGSSVKLKSAE